MSWPCPENNENSGKDQTQPEKRNIQVAVRYRQRVLESERNETKDRGKGSKEYAPSAVNQRSPGDLSERLRSDECIYHQADARDR